MEEEQDSPPPCGVELAIVTLMASPPGTFVVSCDYHEYQGKHLSAGLPLVLVMYLLVS